MSRLPGGTGLQPAGDLPGVFRLLSIVVRTWLRAAALTLGMAACFRAAGDDVSILQIRTVEGEGAVHRCGARAAASIAVLVTDETGKPVEGVTVSFRMPEEGAGGLFANGLATAVVATDSTGRASVAGMRWNRVPGPLHVRVTAAKGQARAGTTIFVYLSDTAVVPSRFRRRLLWTVLGLGAAAGVGYAAANRTKSASGGLPPAPIQIGNPTIAIGRP